MILLDTHALLWWLLDDQRLSVPAREQIRRSDQIVFVSSASGWEIATKHRLGKLGLGSWDPATLPTLLEGDRIDVLPVSLAHALEAGLLPGPHRDPFDRVLIAQSRIEGLSIVSRDPVFSEYGLEVIW